MSEPASPHPTTERAGAARQMPSTGRWPVVLSAMAFLLGALLGAGLTIAFTGGSPDAGHATSPSAEPSEAAPGSGDLVLPASCREAVERVQEASTTAREAMQALRRLETARLQELLDRLQQTQTKVDALADECRAQTRTLPAGPTSPSGGK
ncbi:hypothetical protein [Actinoplanes sp. NPDC026619]|uniref:hypothetical protein n=1 Tax=Actinoplanes sp. NPDC026619 TaxID=3155798 RepID=UPI0033FAE279